MRLTCPNCATALKAKDGFGSKAVRCPKCDHQFSVPSEPSPESAEGGDPFAGLADPAEVTREQATRKLEEASRRSSLSLSIFLLLVGLSHVGFHAILYFAAGRAKERIAERDARAYEQDGDWSRKHADELLHSDRAFQAHLREKALLETAEQRHRLVYGMLLGLVVTLFAFGARESPLTVSTITLLCLTGFVAVSISIPFVDYAATGGFLYLVSIAVECAVLLVWMFQPLLAKGRRG